MKRTIGPLGVLGALLLCLPCLLPLTGVLGGVAVLSALSGLIMDNALAFGLGVGGITASLATAACIVRTYRRRGSACDLPDA